MEPKREPSKIILISPLNWGLGHATRLIPIIHKLRNDGHTCIISGESPSIDILKETFPELEYIYTKGFRVKFSKGSQQWLKLLFQLPSFISSIYKDKNQVEKIIAKNNIDIIISDNRYGFRNSAIPSIIISHQTSPETGPKFKWINWTSTKIITTLINQFDALWIPDSQTSTNLSGRLSSAKTKIPTNYIGLLSRLSVTNENTEKSTKLAPDRLVILSGPEPQRSILEQLLIDKFSESNLSTLILQGLPGQKNQKPAIGSVSFMANCQSFQLKQLLKASKTIICRSGYSTLMDLFVMNRRAILIPTPGQYEQEYLADRLNDFFGFKSISQSQIHLLPETEFKQLNTRIKLLNNFKSCHLPYFTDIKK
ncbi:glycosyltransferase [Carboxylicivirga sp. N1Y90]|uniref:glycosyltransferase n=1 Tax=Carboxylicivirga fragile TaxID=3417571 RepID=UPI003D33D898|nr:hypothetical protein [Marinilabiliaceae bacterium N1Y90]